MRTLHATRSLLVLAVVGLLAGAAAAPAQDLVIKKYTNGQDADLPPGPPLTVGTAVSWTYVVTNQSSRDADITGIVVSDDQGVTVTCPQTSLAVGESMTCTGTGTAQVGQYANIGTATGLVGPVGVTASDPSHYFGQAAAVLTLVKATNGQDANAPPGPVVAVGDPIAWSYTVTNIGADNLTDVTVTDDQGVTVTCPQTTLSAGESMVCTASGIALPAQYANLGIATALLPDESTVVATDPSHYFGRNLDLDYGDAPAAHPTSLAANGARHLLGSNVYLGACVDAEIDGPTTAAVDGDDAAASSVTFGTCALAGDDEDGVTFTTVIGAGTTAGASVAANQACTLSAWIDFNRDGDWGDSGENLFPGGTALAAGANSLSFAVPPSASAGPTAARWRCSSDGPLADSGPALDGEVEDYLVTIVTPTITALKTTSLFTDLNGDGQIDPGDTLAYTVVLANSGAVAATAVTFTDTPDPTTILVNGSVSTSLGSITSGNVAGESSVGVSIPTLASGASATIGFRVTVNSPLPATVTQIANQGQVAGGNFATLLTDDPAPPGVADPTISLVERSIVEIPTLGAWGLAGLAALVGLAGARRLRRRRR
jgi:uncharacterized repeat protein (TIGR01451 family)